VKAARSGHFLIIAASAFSLLSGDLARAITIRVDDSATGSNDGTSWCDAYLYLQDALAAAAASGGAINEILVAQGTYVPDQGAGSSDNDRASTFRLLNGVAIEGGYAGCGTINGDDRDVHAYETILSGDLLGNDVGDRFSGSRSDNAYHVVTGNGTSSTAILDGVTITGSHADGVALPHSSGGGLYNDDGDPTVVDCTFVENWANANGGAMYNRNNSDPVVVRGSFIENSAGYGGAVHSDGGSDGAFIDCLFRRNTVGLEGGALYNSASSFPTFRRCTFLENESLLNGGAATQPNAMNPARPSFTDCLFEKNCALNGSGGALRTVGGSATVTNCTFRENIAAIDGGAISSIGATDVLHSTFDGNHAQNGGAFFNQGRSALSNCLLVGNMATSDGGGVYHLGFAGFFVQNTTLTRNEAGDQGGGVFNAGSSLHMFDNIVFGNRDGGAADETAQIDGTAPNIHHSCVQGWTGTLGGDGNHGGDPMFVPGPASCFYLSQTAAGQSTQSPCVDAAFGMAVGTYVEGRTTRSDEAGDAGGLDQGYHHASTGCGIGKYQCDLGVDLRDFAAFQDCFVGATAKKEGDCCGNFNLDGLPGVALEDYQLFAEALAGP